MAKLTGTDGHRDRIVEAALSLLVQRGRDAVTTRNVAEAARVQPPVLYRIFGDKGGLLEAVAAHGFAAYLAKKRPPVPEDDPVEALRAGWDLHVQFGLDNPELYLLMYADPRPGAQGEAARQSFRMLAEHMGRVAAAGHLRVSAARACAVYHAGAVGVVLSLLAEEPNRRDAGLSHAVREQALAAVTTQAPAVPSPALATMANGLHALLEQSAGAPRGFTGAETRLLLEWLRRLTDSD